jgi:methylated-DNA-[protein]-cysteine S-methyltransferase
MHQNTVQPGHLEYCEQTSVEYLESLLNGDSGFGPAAGRFSQAAVGLIPSSAAGPLMIGVSAQGIAMIHFLRDPTDPAHAIASLRRRFDPVPDQNAVTNIAGELERFMAGDESELRGKIDLSLVAGKFQRAVLEHLLEVGPGAILTYSSLAAWANAPAAWRAVGAAMHDNPIPIYVPCHRVVRSDLGLGGYGGGLDLKRKLLGVEGFSFTPAGRVAEQGAVWGNRKTRIYCRPDCRALARAKRANNLLLRNTSRAKQSGMRPCRLCQPL